LACCPNRSIRLELVAAQDVACAHVPALRALSRTMNGSTRILSNSMCITQVREREIPAQDHQDVKQMKPSQEPCFTSLNAPKEVTYAKQPRIRRTNAIEKKVV
jgi:hypothetical protein